MRIDLPWPYGILSPNARVHWRTSARAKSVYRRACWVATLQQIDCSQNFLRDIRSVPLRIDFAPPGGRKVRDLDNLVAAMKSGLDGVADALRVDDAIFQPLTAVVSAPAGKGKVIVTIMSGEP